MRAGDPRAIARAISLVEDEASDASGLIRGIYRETGRAYLIGVTGAPGTGNTPGRLGAVKSRFPF